MKKNQRHSSILKFRSMRVCVFLLMLCMATTFIACAHKTPPIRPQKDNQTLRAYPQAQLETATATLGPAQALSQAMDVFVNTDIYYDFDSYAITPAAETILLEKIKFLNDNPQMSVQIEGHCDERGTTEYNLALGQKRADSARQYLATHGIDAGRMEAISYGKEKPMDASSGEDAWSKNRRAHFNITKQ